MPTQILPSSLGDFMIALVYVLLWPRSNCNGHIGGWFSFSRLARFLISSSLPSTWMFVRGLRVLMPSGQIRRLSSQGLGRLFPTVQPCKLDLGPGRFASPHVHNRCLVCVFCAPCCLRGGEPGVELKILWQMTQRGSPGLWPLGG